MAKARASQASGSPCSSTPQAQVHLGSASMGRNRAHKPARPHQERERSGGCLSQGACPLSMLGVCNNQKRGSWNQKKRKALHNKQHQPLLATLNHDHGRHS